MLWFTSMSRPKALAAVALAVLLLAACASSDIPLNTQELTGTIGAIDLSNRSIDLAVANGATAMLSSGGAGAVVRVHFDGETAVSFKGQSYRPEDLELGDEVVVSVGGAGERRTASSVVIVRDSSRVTGQDSNLSYGLTLHGTVASVDAANQAIEIDRAAGANVIVEYEMNTPVHYDNQTYPPADLERGDEVEVIFRDIDDSTHVMAEDITVTRNAGGDAYGGSTTETATVRGTVVATDPAKRTIEIESASWISTFNGGTTTGTTFVIEYGTRTRVSASGSFAPVSGLSRGDVVEVQVTNPTGSTLVAQAISVIKEERP